MPLIEVRDCEKTFPDGTKALRGVSFNIEAGEFVAIMGPSGSGKSTLLHILGFLDRHTGGSYLFDGKAIDDYSDIDMAQVRNTKMGFVFQSFNLLARTNVLENVKLPLLYSDVDESEWFSRSLATIKEMGLEHRLYHDVAKLSGGERQRVAMARALVNRPQVIFADEPTGNLDSKSGEIVMANIQKLNKELGHTIILVTHESYAARYAGRIIYLKDGLVARDHVVTHRYQSGDKYIK